MSFTITAAQISCVLERISNGCSCSEISGKPRRFSLGSMQTPLHHRGPDLSVCLTPGAFHSASHVLHLTALLWRFSRCFSKFSRITLETATLNNGAFFIIITVSGRKVNVRATSPLTTRSQQRAFARRFQKARSLPSIFARSRLQRKGIRAETPTFIPFTSVVT